MLRCIKPTLITFAVKFVSKHDYNNDDKQVSMNMSIKCNLFITIINFNFLATIKLVSSGYR